jgi:F-type H+-transporting ATPase subunit b
MVAVEELFAEVVAEITHNPLIFAAEVAQFLILVFALRLLAKRILGPMLERRRQQVLDDLAEADRADERVAEAHKEAKRIVAEANQQAQERIREAKEGAAAEFEQAVAAVGEEATNVVKQARQTLEQEETEAVSSVHTKLVDLVTVATRNVLDEALSEQERRDLVEKSVLSSLEELEDVAIAE